jgi:hypothetical protein
MKTVDLEAEKENAAAPGPMELDAFLAWCQEGLQLDWMPNPGTEFRDDLHLDDLELFTFALRFNELASVTSTVTLDVFSRLESIRDLYLYYLTIGSMPHE